MAATVRRILPSESLQLREIRLAALFEAPHAFGGVHKQESELPISHWVQRAESSAQGNVSATFFAEEAAALVGLVGGFRPTERSRVVELVSMWVAPRVRGTGLAEQLVHAVLGWAHQIGVEDVNLWVMGDNEPATRLYASLGFDFHADFQPAPDDPCRDETRMRLIL